MRAAKESPYQHESCHELATEVHRAGSGGGAPAGNTAQDMPILSSPPTAQRP